MNMDKRLAAIREAKKSIEDSKWSITTIISLDFISNDDLEKCLVHLNNALKQVKTALKA